MLFTHFTFIDYLILLVILLMIIWCYRKGFVGSTLSLLCWVIAIGGSFKLAQPVGNMFENSIKNEYVRNIIGFFIVFILLALVGVLILYLFNHLIEKATLHKTDKIIGGFSGIIVGIFLVSSLLLIGDNYPPIRTKSFWTNSYLIPYLHPFVDIINDVLPASVQAERDLFPDMDVDETLEKSADDLKDKVSDVKDKVSDVKDKAQETLEQVTD